MACKEDPMLAELRQTKARLCKDGLGRRKFNTLRPHQNPFAAKIRIVANT